MKELIPFVVLSALALGPVGGRAQSEASDLGAGADSPSEYVITGCGPHERTWARVSWEKNSRGDLVTVTNAAYVELSTGLHYWDPTSAQWAESQELFELTPEGYAVARQGQHQVILAPNLNAPNAVDLQMPDGQRLTSRPLGLAFHDPGSGKSVLIAELKDCAGQLISPNVVLYPDAFEGLKAAVRYTYTRAGFEQDIVLYENPGSPAAYGMAPETTQLEIWTEFTASPTPQLTALSTEDGSGDEQVEFGAMALGQGQAYFLSLAHHDEPSVPVRKSWQQIEGRTFLVESVSYATSQPLLDRLVAVPEARATQLAHRVVKSRAALVAQFSRPAAVKPVLTAGITPGQMSSQPGLVLVS